jgi:phosphatidylglycerophosphatase A
MSFRKFIVKLITTFFGVGFAPFIPGTFATLAGLGIFFLVRSDTVFYLGVTALLIILGFLFSGEAEKLFQKKDARCIVIDEISGILLSLLFIPYSLKIVIIAFFLFRVLDALKPFPAGRLQDLRGSAGVMTDDIVAGLYTSLILQAVVRLASFKVS